MVNKNISLLTSEQLQQLEESLYFLHVKELKNILNDLNLSKKTGKVEIINAILLFIKRGKMPKKLSYPSISCARKGEHFPLCLDTLIKYGSYKNDLRTRLFLRSCIGEHFHFTVFGHDWIKEQWKKGEPPTYKEFCDYWQKQYEKNKVQKPEPKKEWRFIRFTQEILKRDPFLTSDQIRFAWMKERMKNVKIVELLITKIKNS